MLFALCLTLLLGITWIAIGIVMSTVARRHDPIIIFFAVGPGLLAALMWAGYVRWPVLLQGGVERPMALVLTMVLAGITNAGGQLLIVFTMRKGHQGMAWAIAQSAMAGSFLATWAIWGESYTLNAWLGIAAMVIALAMLATDQARGETGRIQPSWLLLAAATFIVIATTQVLMGTPSRWSGWEDTARLRIPLSLTAGAIIHGTAALIMRQRLSRRLAGLAVIWALLALVAYRTMYAAFDSFAPYGRTAIVFPIGIGVCVFGFSIYSRARLREPLKRATALGLLILLTGVALLIAGL